MSPRILQATARSLRAEWTQDHLTYLRKKRNKRKKGLAQRSS
jgi:hypothetical protein